MVSSFGSGDAAGHPELPAIDFLRLRTTCFSALRSFIRLETPALAFPGHILETD
jgi:hypothetical protein